MFKSMVTAVTIIAAFSTSPPVAHAATTQVVAIALQDASADPSISGMVMKIDKTKVKVGHVTPEAVNQ